MTGGRARGGRAHRALPLDDFDDDFDDEFDEEYDDYGGGGRGYSRR